MGYHESAEALLDKLNEYLELDRQDARNAVHEMLFDSLADEFDRGRDQGRKEISQYCPNCGSCGEADCCPAPGCRYFDHYDKNIGQHYTEALKHLTDLREQYHRVSSLVYRGETVIKAYRARHAKCEVSERFDSRCTLCKAADRVLGDIGG